MTRCEVRAELADILEQTALMLDRMADQERRGVDPAPPAELERAADLLYQEADAMAGWRDVCARSPFRVRTCRRR